MHSDALTLGQTLPAPIAAPTLVRGLPLIGTLPSMMRDAPGFLLECARARPGEIFSVKLGPVELPIVYRPDHLQTVLVDGNRDFTKGGMWSVTKRLLGEGLVTSDGELWRKQRQLLQPLFTPRHIGAIAGLMGDAIETQVEDLAGRAGQIVDVGAEMTLLTQRVLLESLFGASMNPDTARSLGQALNDAFEAMNTQLFLFFLPEWFPKPADGKYKRAVAAIDEAILGMITERRAHPVESTDVLSRLLGARDADTGEGMSDRQIRDELVTLFVAGLDTTAVALTWMFHLLDAHPDVDAKVRAEIDAVLGGRRPGPEDVMKLGYTRQVIQETMRLYPPAWMIPRYASKDALVGGRMIKKGTTMLVVPWLTHRDTLSWDNADSFDPDRFAPNAGAGRPKLAYVPFGAGGRQCIGNHFAMMEAMLAATRLIQRFRPVPVSDKAVVPASSSTLKPKGGLKMRFELRGV